MVKCNQPYRDHQPHPLLARLTPWTQEKLPWVSGKRIPVGAEFGLLTVIAEPEIRSQWNYSYLCRCACGRGMDRWFRSHILRNGLATHCGCLDGEKSRQRYSIIPQTVWAYVAGIIDGEGTIRFRKTTTTRAGEKLPTFHGKLTVANTYRPLIEWFKNTFGGGITSSRRDRPVNHLPCYNWVLGRREGSLILERCLPFLRIKKERALLFLEGHRLFEPLGPDYVQYPMVARRLEEIADTMYELNKRGVGGS